ncbi:uncharacterized protein LOC129752198 [Uranotaenia lowii]|uniref:uncharacterized protein LOC129752198 n=1 Tax=Uranotaenia lowii TaxID=190385 RepID=UPI00247A321F|nr:uncharacterized protein LOC129752198 [Uranotaenia lowii]
MTEELRRLSKKEEILWNLLEHLDDFLHEYDDDRDHCSLQPRLNKLDEAYNTFCDLRTQIEVITEDLDAENDSEGEDGKRKSRRIEYKQVFKDFMNQYFSLKQRLLSRIETNPVQTIYQRSPVSDPTMPCHTRYPELTLPTFSGEFSNWINFRDNFRSLIHDNALLNDMDKFNYLRTSLRDDALIQINQISVSSINYGLAWSILESKYENHKLIAQEHLKALFTAPAMRTESFEGLNALLTTFRTNLQQLEKLGQNTSNWSTLLAFMLSQKLDIDTYRMWETHHASKNVPSYDAMVQFLENQCSILQSTANRGGNEDHRNPKAPICNSAIAVERTCPVCRNGPHITEECSRFSRMRVIDRKVLVRRLGLCFNCLGSGHFVADCSHNFCLKCGQRHHFLLHPYSPNQSSQLYTQSYSQSPRRPQRANSESERETYTQQNQSQMNSFQSSQNSSQTTQPPPTPSVSHHTLLSTQSHSHNAILSTAVVMLADNSGNTIKARALLDNGSQICLLTERLSQKLKFERCRENRQVKAVGGAVNLAKESVSGLIISCTSSFRTSDIKFYVLPRITMDLPQRSFDVSTWNLSPSTSLADPTFNESSSIDMVIGVATFYELLLAEQIRITDSGPFLQNTRLGWIVAGELPEAQDMCSLSAEIQEHDGWIQYIFGFPMDHISPESDNVRNPWIRRDITLTSIITDYQTLPDVPSGHVAMF